MPLFFETDQWNLVSSTDRRSLELIKRTMKQAEREPLKAATRFLGLSGVPRPAVASCRRDTSPSRRHQTFRDKSAGPGPTTSGRDRRLNLAPELSPEHNRRSTTDHLGAPDKSDDLEIEKKLEFVRRQNC